MIWYGTAPSPNPPASGLGPLHGPSPQGEGEDWSDD